MSERGGGGGDETEKKERAQQRRARAAARWTVDVEEAARADCAYYVL